MNNQTVWQEFTERFDWASGLSGEALVEAIGAHWDEMNQTEMAHMFRRMAMYVAAHEGVSGQA